MATHRRCNSKDHPEGEDRWHSIRDACPHCGDEPVFNKALYTSKLNNHLYGQVEKQHKEKQFVKKVATEKPPA